MFTMITKQISRWISLALSVWILATVLIFAYKIRAFELGLVGSGLVLAPIILPLLPLAVLLTNRVYKEFKLSLTTSIMQIVFFIGCFAFGATLLNDRASMYSGIALLAVIISLLLLAAKAAFAKTKNKYNDPKKRTITLLALAVVVWLPASLFVNPGWGTLMLFTPYVLIAFVPLLVLLANSWPARSEAIGRLTFAGEMLFLLLWASLGFLYVNGGDTEESTGSLLSKIFGGIWGNDFLIQLSPIALKLVAFLALALLPFIFLYKQGRSILFKVLPIAVTVVAMVFCVMLLFADDKNARNQAQPLTDVYDAIQKDVIDPAGGKAVSYEAVGVGLSEQLKCKPGARCPMIKVSWLVPVDKDKEWDFIWNAIQKEGYSNPDPVFPCFPGTLARGGDCSEWGLKSGSEIWVWVKPVDASKMPAQDVSPKQWRLLEVEITPYETNYIPRQGEVHTLDELNIPAR